MKEYLKCLLVLTVLLFASAQGLAQVGNRSREQRVKLFDDPRVIAWSRDFLAGKREAVIRSVEQDLKSPAPHPFAPHIWVNIQFYLGHKKEAWQGIRDPQLKAALGILPDVDLLFFAGEYKELLKRYPASTVNQINDPWAPVPMPGIAGAYETRLYQIIVVFSPDGKSLFTSGSDGLIKAWFVKDIASEKGRDVSMLPFCKLIYAPNGQWAVVDAAGRYDTLNGGDMDGVHWVIGTETIALSQLKRYYEPGLLGKEFGFNKEPLRMVDSLKDIKMFPQVVAQLPKPGSSQLKVTLTNRGGGIGKVRVLVNGKEIAADARGPAIDPKAAKAELSVDLSGAALLPGKENQIEVIAWNEEGYLSSRGAHLLFKPPDTIEDPKIKPQLYASSAT
jgi:hypothetical protein